MIEQPCDSRIAVTAGIYDDLMARYGPLLAGQDLVRALGFRNAAALRQARLRGAVAVPVFSLPSRKGTFAMTRDVAAWLVSVAEAQEQEQETQM